MKKSRHPTRSDYQQQHNSHYYSNHHHQSSLRAIISRTTITITGARWRQSTRARARGREGARPASPSVFVATSRARASPMTSRHLFLQGARGPSTRGPARRPEAGGGEAWRRWVRGAERGRREREGLDVLGGGGNGGHGVVSKRKR